MDLSCIRADLPDTPDEVISIWLSTHFGRFGWPPKIDNDWRYILGLGRDLKFLQALKWSKGKLALSPQGLTDKTRATIVGLFQTYVLKHRTMYSVVSDGPERFRSCCEYLKETGTFPQPIVLFSAPEGFEVLDGNHRLTAFFYLYGFFRIQNEETPCLKVSQEQEVWVAST